MKRTSSRHILSWIVLAVAMTAGLPARAKPTTAEFRGGKHGFSAMLGVGGGARIGKLRLPNGQVRRAIELKVMAGPGIAVNARGRTKIEYAGLRNKRVPRFEVVAGRHGIDHHGKGTDSADGAPVRHARAKNWWLHPRSVQTTTGRGTHLSLWPIGPYNPARYLGLRAVLPLPRFGRRGASARPRRRP